MNLLLQILGPLALGLVYTLSNFHEAGMRRLGRLLFLLAQLILIYAIGLGSVAGLALVLCLLSGFAQSAAVAMRRPLVGPAWLTIFFIAYLIYWFAEKYAPALLGLFQPSAAAIEAVKGQAALVSVVGMSYIGFKFIHFFVDYKDKGIPEFDALDFLNWMFFFPSIVAGPMQRFQDWQEQFGTLRFTGDESIYAIRRVLLGVFMKVVIADNIRALTLPEVPMGALATAPWSSLALGALVYSFYLYFDFAGYSHIAVGTGLFWGIRLPENFDNPFVARNLAEFWNRWHITLSRILRDYLFYPLNLQVKRMTALRKRPMLAAAIPPIVTFLLAGLWHGVGIGFIVFGLLHGVGLAYLAIRRVRSKPAQAVSQRWLRLRAGLLLAITCNFLYVSLTFVFFSLSTDKLGVLANRIFAPFV